jgi:bifunctional NMN adenylyltransferase/nudix hydrolase
MKPKSTEVRDVGVIVGRFQVPELHEAHQDLIQAVCEAHDKVVVFLGLSSVGAPTKENPLDFQARKQMLLEKFPQLNILYIKDLPSDELWSRNLDGKVQDVVTPNQKPVLYGGRDSFIARYSGKYPTLELEPEVYVNFSGTETRRTVARMSTHASPEFRKGVIWTTQSKFPTCYPTVDVAVLNKDEVLLAKKPHEDKWRFIGGFADPRSTCYEQDARREVAEEAHIAITDPKYVGSAIIDDWRYRAEVDKIKTIFFVALLQSGAPRPDDDIEELRWFPFGELFSEGVAGKSVGRTRPEIVVPSHYPLMEMLKQHLFQS